MTIHGAPLSVSVSLLSLSTPFWESPSPPYTHKHAHTLCGTHTHKRRMGYSTEKKVVHSFSHPVLPVAQTFSQLSPKLFLFSALLLSQRPASFSHLHLPTGREQRREVQKAPWPSLPHLPSRWDFPHPSTDLCFVLTFDWNHSGREEIKEWSTSMYLALDVCGTYFPRFFSLFFSSLNGKWSRDASGNIGAQANRRLDRCRTSLSKRNTEGAHEKR